jgi:hypothetical protein
LPASFPEYFHAWQVGRRHALEGQHWPASI